MSDAPTKTLATAHPSELDDFAQIVARAVGVPVALITTFDSTFQSFLGQHGLPIDFLMSRAIPRTWSACWHAVTTGSMLVAPDARVHPVTKNLPFVEMGIIGGYASAPFEVTGLGAGTVCVIDPAARPFESDHRATLEQAARVAAVLLETRHAQAPSVQAPVIDSTTHHIGIGTLIDGKYWITASLGRGGQGEVLLGRDRLIGQLVAIKFVVPGCDEEMLQHEAIALAAVRHPNVVRLYGWGRTPDQRFFIVLEYLEGESLAAHLRAHKESPIPLERVLAILSDVADGLSALHAHGIVHSDIKPANVVLDRQLGRAVLVDFGVASIAARGGAHGGGTPGFSAPEQFMGATAAPSADVYGLGALAYALLRGQGPFAHLDSAARVLAQSHGPPPPVHGAEVPASVDEVLSAALSPLPSARPPNVQELADRLSRALGIERPRR